MKKPRIAIIGTRGYPVVYSGFETWVKELCNGLNDKYEFHVYTHKKLSSSRDKIINGIHIHYFDAIETKSLSQWSHSLQSTVHAIFQNYDILVYASTANGIFGVITKLFNQRTAINVDGLDWLRPKWKGFGSKVFYNSAKLSTRVFDVLISDAEAIAEYYKKELGSNSVVIAYGAHIDDIENSSSLNLFNLIKNDYFLVVGRLIPDNHILEIVNGFKLSKSNKKLVIVGDVPYKDKFAEEVKLLADERVVFTGFIKDSNILKSLYTNSYAYIHGHAYGGTNPSLLKALAYGCCVLAHDNVFNREMLSNTEFGIYFNSAHENISMIINDIDKNDSKVLTMKLNARNRIIENYTWDKILNQYDQLFERMLKDPKWKCNKYI